MDSTYSTFTWIDLFRKVALLEMLRNPLLTGVTDLQPAVCTATKTKFFQNALKISENVRVEFCNGVLL